VLTREPALPGFPAKFKISWVISGTKFSILALGFVFGFESKRPSSSVKSNNKSAFQNRATSLESLSLSPTFISAVAMESFSFITGITLCFSIELKVFCRFL